LGGGKFEMQLKEDEITEAENEFARLKAEGKI